MNIIGDFWLDNNKNIFNEQDKLELLKRAKFLPTPHVLRVWDTSPRIVMYKLEKFNNSTVLVRYVELVNRQTKKSFWKRLFKK